MRFLWLITRVAVPAASLALLLGSLKFGGLMHIDGFSTGR